MSPNIVFQPVHCLSDQPQGVRRSPPHGLRYHANIIPSQIKALQSYWTSTVKCQGMEYLTRLQKS